MQDVATELRSVMAVGRDELERELFLEDKIDSGRLEMASGGVWNDLAVLVGEIEEFIEDFGGKMERWIGEDFVGFSWQIELQEVLFDDANILNAVFLEILAEFLGGAMIGLDSPNLADALG